MKLLLPLAAIALLYVTIVVVVALTQDRFLFFPTAVGLESASRHGLEPWPDPRSHRGFVTKSTLPSPAGTFLVWHGNAGSTLDRTYYVEALQQRGYRVVLLEYPGYGGREGDLGESSFVADALLATQRALDEFDAPLYLLGESLGGAVATAVATRAPVDGVVLITPWATLPDLAQAVYPFLPARWIVRDRWDSVRNLAQYEGPVFVAMSERDEVIPAGHAQRLYDSIDSRKQLHIFARAGHNSWPFAADDPWWDEMLGFLHRGE